MMEEGDHSSLSVENTISPPSVAVAVHVPPEASQASLRWRLLRHYLLRKPGALIEEELEKVSRRPKGHFDLIPFQIASSYEVLKLDYTQQHKLGQMGVVLVEYNLPIDANAKLVLMQKQSENIDLSDFTNCQEHRIDNTGIIGLWPAEEILTYFCVSRSTIFRNKRVVELGSGYGLAGLAIAACSDAVEVLLTDGNPQVVDYLEQNIKANLGAFGGTEVKASILHWCQESFPDLESQFDTVIAADCTFFKESHCDLAYTIKNLLRRSEDCQALLFSPHRGGSLESFVQVAQGLSLNVEVTEQYDDCVWNVHQQFLQGCENWPNYDPEYCYPLLISINHADLKAEN